ncbi:hypothetical protein PYW07_012610 [Mythimna separata]|uniref:Uncharacterized protein n=1 Tax=Mythimna separata TaxID=271217 RepID=A0AAD7Y8W1_MYTSE|nr:hypothetical protein PYW07_012610 [Mythimna separata]
MRCCVQSCLNDDSKKTNKSLGITFHKIPKDSDHSAAWLKALAAAGCRMNKCLVVCSEHFLPDDFDDTRHNQRRVKSGVVPTLMSPLHHEELKVCRVCLALDVKMYDLNDYKLSVMFQNVTGISDIDKKGNILQRLCWECTARLTAAAVFRNKALLSDTLLKDLVHITKSDVETIKQYHSTLKSPLTTQNLFTSTDIECEDSFCEKEEKDKLLNEDTKTKRRKTKMKTHKVERNIDLEEFEPWIDIPVKTEVETDPIAENSFNIRLQNQNCDAISDFDDSVTSLRADIEDDTKNSEVQINNNINSYGLREDIEISNVPLINKDGNIVLVQDSVERKPKLDVTGNIIVDEAISNIVEHNQYAVKEVSVKNAEKKISKEVGTLKKDHKVEKIGDAVGGTNEKATIRSNEIKQKIIALKKKGFSAPAIAKETGLSINSVYNFLYRFCKNSNITYRRSTTLGRDHTVVENEPDQNYYYEPNEAGKEVSACSITVRRRLRQAGLERILMVKPERSVGQKISKYKALHDILKERIVALKQEGLSNSRIAYLLETTRDTVRKWWLRYCKDGHMDNLKTTGPKRKTTAQEDQLLVDRVAQEQTVHTPTLAREMGLSSKSVRNRLREAGFKLKERKASVPLRSGRSHKVDEETKQQIVSMKLNGVSVTDIANQFRVTRTSVYLWWRRWCKENNIKITSDNNRTTTTEQEKKLPVENIVQAPSILSSKKSLWQKLPDLEFIS